MRKHQSGINYSMLTRVVGWLLIIEAGFMAIPLATSVFYSEKGSTVAFGISALVTAAAGLMMATLTHPERKEFGKRESFILTVSVWVVFSLFGMIPYMLTANPLSMGDAFIEAMSGFTTTGLSSVSPGSLTRGQMMWSCVMQWIGGMGIILFTLAVLPMLNHSGGMQMFNAETTGITHDKLRPRISQTAKDLWIIYIILTIILCLFLSAGPLGFYDALCITFATVSTGGGYAPASQLLADSVFLKILVTVFMFLGGVNFHILFKLAHGNFRAPADSEVFRVYVYIIAGAFLLFVPAIWYHSCMTGIGSITVDPLFQIVSALSSTGFTAPDFKSWGPFVYTIVMFLMFIGASAGSTSGGAKIDRIIYLWKCCRNEITRTLRPNTILSVRLNGRIVPPELVGKVMVFLAIYVGVIGFGGVALTAFGVEPEDAFFTAFMCISNCGVDSETAGYGVSFATLPALAKWIMAFIMLAGRLELFTVFVLLTPGFWRR